MNLSSSEVDAWSLLASLSASEDASGTRASRSGAATQVESEPTASGAPASSRSRGLAAVKRIRIVAKGCLSVQIF